MVRRVGTWRVSVEQQLVRLVFDDRPGKRKDSPGIELFPECLQIDCSILHADKVIFIGCYMLLETNELMNY